MAPYWYVYVLTSTAATRTYVGIALDVERRLTQHNGQTPGGARSTRMGRPWALAAVYGPYTNRAEAQRIERHVKNLRGSARLGLLALAGGPERAPKGAASSRAVSSSNARTPTARVKAQQKPRRRA